MRGGAPASGRKEAELVQRNLKDSVTALSGFCQRYRPRRLVLAGAEHTVAQFHNLLPAALKDIVAGTFTATMDAGENEIRDHSFALLAELTTKRREELIETTITAAAKGQNGVLGLDATLSVANEGRIQVLVVERDYHAPGYQCSSCGYLTTQSLDKCVFCDGSIIKILDAVEGVVSQVVEKGGAVEVVDNKAMGETQIGALLRY
jgi:peptide chain release factor subunit 1